MTGPEHYRAAERSLAEVAARSSAMHGQTMTAAQSMEMHAAIANGIASAQVHATLALAAATISAGYPDGAPAGTDEDWWQVISS
jgi:uncharacterized protein YijF (DUF1287 family)